MAVFEKPAGTLAESQIGIWIVPIDDDTSDVAMHFVSDQERERSDRYRRAADCVAFIAARAVLRLLLSDLVGALPREISLKVNPGGKAYLADQPPGAKIEFSISRTDGYSVIALSRSGLVGIDIERRRHVCEGVDIAHRIFGSDVARKLSRFPEPQRGEIFLRLWTAAEAYMKAIGRGLKTNFKPLPVHLTGSGTVRMGFDPDFSCAISAIEVPTECVAHVALLGPI